METSDDGFTYRGVHSSLIAGLGEDLAKAADFLSLFTVHKGSRTLIIDERELDARVLTS